MASEQLIQDIAGSTLKQFCFCVSGSLSPADAATDWRIDTPTTVAMTLASLASAGAWQSLKIDLGALRARRYAVFGCVDYSEETPVLGQTIDYYWAPSSSGTQATGNVAGNSGADAACPDGALGTILIAEFVKQCQKIGQLVIHDGASVQNGYVGKFSPATRYGQLILVNSGGDAFEDDDVEAHQTMNPIVDESQ